jgi:hypothetical protein
MISVLNSGKVPGAEVSLLASGTAKEVAVCANIGLNQPITYLIEDPFYSVNASSTYDVDWGDGGMDKRIFTTSMMKQHTKKFMKDISIMKNLKKKQNLFIVLLIMINM